MTEKTRLAETRKRVPVIFSSMMRDLEQIDIRDFLRFCRNRKIPCQKNPGTFRLSQQKLRTLVVSFQLISGTQHPKGKPADLKRIPCRRNFQWDPSFSKEFPCPLNWFRRFPIAGCFRGDDASDPDFGIHQPQHASGMILIQMGEEHSAHHQSLMSQIIHEIAGIRRSILSRRTEITLAGDSDGIPSASIRGQDIRRASSCVIDCGAGNPFRPVFSCPPKERIIQRRKPIAPPEGSVRLRSA